MSRIAAIEKPDLRSFTPVEEYKSSTPVTFAPHEEDHPAVIFGYGDAGLRVSSDETPCSSLLLNLDDCSVSYYITSSSLLLWSSSLGKGYTVPYPRILLHALKSDGSIYMQINDTDHDEDTFLELYVTPADNASHEVYEAMSACAAMHADGESDSGESPALGFVPAVNGAGDVVDYEVGEADDDVSALPVGDTGEFSAGVEVLLEKQQLAGVRRGRDEAGGSEDSNKWRKLDL